MITSYDLEQLIGMIALASLPILGSIGIGPMTTGDITAPFVLICVVGMSLILMGALGNVAGRKS